LRIISLQKKYQKKNMKANLSVIVNNYNKPAQQIEECFQSLRDQTVQPREVIFVDDCSEKRPTYRGVLSVVMPVNGGIAKARSMGVKLSTCKLLLFVDADDKLAPDFIQQCGKKIQQADIVYPNMLYFGDVERNKFYESPEEITAKYLLGKTINIPVTSMMWKKVYEKNEGFRDLPVFEDWDFWIRAMYHGFTFARANTLLWYRQSSDSRNHKTLDFREDVHQQITSPFREEKGKICKI
jgi:glycosyltransferase involved in cell wall biosynthesis